MSKVIKMLRAIAILTVFAGELVHAKEALLILDCSIPSVSAIVVDGGPNTIGGFKSGDMKHLLLTYDYSDKTLKFEMNPAKFWSKGPVEIKADFSRGVIAPPPNGYVEPLIINGLDSDWTINRLTSQMEVTGESSQVISFDPGLLSVQRTDGLRIVVENEYGSYWHGYFVFTPQRIWSFAKNPAFMGELRCDRVFNRLLDFQTIIYNSLLQD